MSGKEDGSSKEGDGRGNVKVVERPTFILKTREGENRALSPSQRNGNKYNFFSTCNNFISTMKKR